MKSVIEQIAELKQERNAIILAHNYTLPEIQNVADFVGDSLGLSIKAAETDADVIVFCGVSFMGEIAKILNPTKTVLIPESEAHCAMAAMCDADQIKEMKKKYPGYVVVGYVNTTAEAKTEMDVCCTSSNAVGIVKALNGQGVIFVPDMNLGAYVKSNVDSDIVLWNGFCPVHHCITVKQVMDLKEKYPSAKLLAHPECREEILNMADFIGSTEKIISAAKDIDSNEFIILTEVSMRHKLENACPEKKFYFPEYAVCATMKMIELKSVVDALKYNKGEIILDERILRDAYKPVKKMTEILD